MSTEGVAPGSAGYTTAVSLTYKNGQECTHELEFPSEDEVWDLVDAISKQMNTDRPGLLCLREPYGVHKLEEVAAVHWANLPPPPPDTTGPPLGFIKG